MRTSTSVYVIGDIHGQFKKLTRLLREVGLVDATLAWVGGTAAGVWQRFVHFGAISDNAM